MNGGNINKQFITFHHVPWSRAFFLKFKANTYFSRQGVRHAVMADNGLHGCKHVNTVKVKTDDVGTLFKERKFTLLKCYDVIFGWFVWVENIDERVLHLTLERKSLKSEKKLNIQINSNVGF